MLKTIVLAAVIACSSMLTACAGFPGLSSNPCEVQGATPQETPKLCVIRGAQLVRASYATIAEQLQRGAITADQAAAAKIQVDKAADAVRLAESSLPLADGTTAERLAFLDQVILDLLRAQAARQ